MNARVLKFGGTSLGDADRIRRAAGIAHGRSAKQGLTIVVVSAMAGVTDDLAALARTAEGGFGGAPGDSPPTSPDTVLGRLMMRHRSVEAALEGDGPATVEPTLARLRAVVSSIRTLGTSQPQHRALLLGFGERLSASLFAAALSTYDTPLRIEDLAPAILTQGDAEEGGVVWERSIPRLRAALSRLEGIVVVPGFVATSVDGAPSLLGRGGSDLTAVLVGAAVQSEMVEIWTDVPGVLSADPRRVPGARIHRTLSLEEMATLARLGARVVQAPAVEAARRARLPLCIRSSALAEDPGTLLRPAAHVERTPGDERGKEKSGASGPSQGGRWPLPHPPRRSVSVRDGMSLVRLGWDGLPPAPTPLFEEMARDCGTIGSLIFDGYARELTVLEPHERAVSLARALSAAGGAVQLLGPGACVSLSGGALEPTAHRRVWSVIEEVGVEVWHHAQIGAGKGIALLIPSLDADRVAGALHDHLCLPDVTARRDQVAASCDVGGGAGSGRPGEGRACLSLTAPAATLPPCQ